MCINAYIYLAQLNLNTTSTNNIFCIILYIYESCSYVTSILILKNRI